MKLTSIRLGSMAAKHMEILHDLKRIEVVAGVTQEEFNRLAEETDCRIVSFAGRDANLIAPNSAL